MTCIVAMNSLKPLVCLILSFCILVCLSQDHFAGPFRIVVHQIAQCDDSGTNQVRMTSVRLNKVSRYKYLFSTNVTIDVTVDDNLTAELEIAVFGNGGWKPHFFQMEIPKFCTSMNEMVPVYFNAVLRALHTECPISPGNYFLDSLDMDDFKIRPSAAAAFPYGRYRSDISGVINGTLIGCIRYYGDIVPNRREQKKKKTK